MLIFPSRSVRIPPDGPAQFPGLTWTYIQKVLATGPLALWTLGDASGTTATELVNGWNGTYSNVTLGQAGIGDGGTSALFVPASQSYVNIYSTNLNVGWNPQEFTVGVWAKYSGAAVLTDGQQRNLVTIGTDLTNNFVEIYKQSANNSLGFVHKAGGTQRAVSITWAGLGWFFAALTASATGGFVKAFNNGSQVGSTQGAPGVWSGALANTECVIGSLTTSSARFSGWEYMAGIWTRALTTEIASLAAVP